MLLIVVAVIFVVLWLVAVTAFKVTKGFVHLLLIIAIIAIVLHFLRGTPAA
jgi:hypothetical protein